jgi:UDP-N-acetylmuramoyl-tripeptide--D-alanyl-D-alanine ligase
LARDREARLANATENLIDNPVRRLLARDGALRRMVRFFRRDWQVPAGRLRRRLARFDAVRGVTGSAGKSTTTRMIGRILESRGPTRIGYGPNTYDEIVRGFVRHDRGTRFWAQEISGHEAEDLQRSATFVRPGIAVVTNVQFDHISIHKDLEATAQSKARLVQALDEKGIAVLNADDPRVAAMADGCRGTVVTFGLSPKADIHAVGWTEGLPGRLCLTVSDGTGEVEVRTRLIGARWVPDILAALACAKALGFTLAESAAALEGFEPEPYKDSVHEKDGVTFVLDSMKGGFWTIEDSVAIVGKASAARRLMVFGTIADYRGDSGRKYRQAARAALEVADEVIFVGPNSERVARLLKDHGGRLRYFLHFDAASAHLRGSIEAGDLVYVKSSGVDHLERLWHDFDRPVLCRLDRCGKLIACNRCKYLYRRRRRRRGRAGA